MGWLEVVLVWKCLLKEIGFYVKMLDVYIFLFILKFDSKILREIIKNG